MKTPQFLASWLVMLTSAAAIPEPLIYSNFDGGSGAPGEINGALDTVPGQIADALTFARDDANFVDYGDVGNPGTGSLTVSMWINPNTTSGGAFFPLGKGNRSSGTVGWSFFIENDVIIPRANYENGGGDLRLGLNHPITVDEGWVHIVMVIDNDNGTFIAYFNGEASGADGTDNDWSLGGGGGQTNTFEAGQNFNPSENFLVGRRSSDGAAFDGAVDDVAIWEEALPAADIVEIYERGLIGQGIPSSDRVIAQSIPAKSVGNVATGNSFGTDFEVRAPVLLTDLGAFDSISDGLFQSPTVELWSRDNAETPDDLTDDTGTDIIATASFSNEEPGRLEGGVRFKSLDEPIVLPVGDYTVVAYGWGAGEEMSDGRQRGNTGVGELADVFQVAFVGARSGGGGAFPDTAEEVGPPNLFGAGNFIVRLLAKDSDGDGLDDGWENFNFGNLAQGGDGDFDNDRSSNAREFASDTNPNKADTDEDGLNDGAEDAAGSNPLLVDSDSDGLTDGAEVNDHGTNPTLADTDEDGFIDGVEIALETSPTNAASSPEETSVFLAASGKSWDDPSAWSDGQEPRAGRNYFVLPELATTLLTPAGSPTFAGDTLTLAGEGTELVLQPDPTGTVTIANLTIEQGSLTHGAVGEIKLAGNLGIVDSLTVGFANGNSTLDLGSTLTGGALTVANDSEPEDEPTRVLKLTGAGNSLTGDVTLKQVRVLAESPGSLGGGNLFLDNASLEPAYNINNPSKSLDLSGDGTRFLLNGQHVLRQISITGTPFITDAGTFTRGDFVAIDAVFETIFAEESTGNFTIVGNSGDSDEDGLLDSWEIENFGDIASADGAGDPDADALTNAEEFTASADPNKKDTDDDGLEDGAEVNTHGTSPASADTDEDGLNDGDEIAANTNPQEADTDGDGLNDGDEVAQQTDPLNADTDGDGVNDGTELALGGDPLDPNNAPNAFLSNLLFYAPLDAAELNLGAGTASEIGPNAFEGTIEGEDVAVDAGQIAQSAVFPGVDTDFISFTDEAINAGTDPFSVSFWFKVNVMQNAFMVSRGNRGSGNEGWSAWFENGNLHTRANGVGLGGGDRVGKNFPGIQEGEWYHLAIVFDREQNKMISYIDASDDGWNVGGGGGQTDNLVPGADFTAGEDLIIGARTGGGFAFDGQIDDVALWKRALSGEEVAMLHESGLSGKGALAEPEVVVEGPLLVELDATDLAAGPITTWENAGGLGGSFAASGDPTVEVIGGVTGVTFDGDGDYFEGPVTTESLEGNSPRSIIAWVYNPELASEETVISWGKRGGPDGTNMSFNHGFHNNFGAIGHWGGGGPDIGWNPNTQVEDDEPNVLGDAEADIWTHIAYTQTGSNTKVFTNGVLTNEEAADLDTHAGTAILVGAQREDDGTTVTDPLKGSLTIGNVRIFEGAISDADIQADFDATAEKYGRGAPTPDIVLTDVGINANGVFGLTLPDGVSADIEFSTDLIDWEVIAPGATGTLEETDVGRLAAPAGFYRAKQ